MPNRQRASSQDQRRQLTPEERIDQAHGVHGAGAGLQDSVLDTGSGTSFIDAAERQLGGGFAMAPDGTTMAQWAPAFNTWLDARATAAQARPADAVAVARGLLALTEGVCTLAAQGRFVDVQRLPTQPAPAGPTGGSFVPPLLIPTVRRLIALTHAPGVPQEDWNSALGVPQYRTQTDNLIGPEVTCGPTTLAMVIERLGITRADVVSAIERQLKIQQLRAAGQAVNDANLATVELAADAWQKAVEAHLRSESRGQSYQRPLPVNQGTERQQEIGAEFQGNAQLEDLVDLLRELLNVDRAGITHDGAGQILAAVTPAGGQPRLEVLWCNGSNWSSIKAAVMACLAAGGAASMSINHKGRDNGSHVVSIQQVTGSGVILDDPYGAIKSNYADGAWGDAYSRGTSSPTRNQASDTSDTSDWQRAAGRNLEASERLGESSVLNDSQLNTRGFVRFVQLYHRAQTSPVTSPRPRARPEGLGQ